MSEAKGELVVRATGESPLDLDVAEVQRELAEVLRARGITAVSASVIILGPEITNSTGLNTHVHELLKGLRPSSLQPAEDSLLDQGLDKAHRILALGKQKTRNQASVASAIVKTIERNLATCCPGITWHKTPTAAQVAEFCTGLHEVPVQVVLTRGLLDIESLGADERRLLPFSVADLLNRHPVLMRVLAPYGALVYQRASVYAAEFTRNR